MNSKRILVSGPISVVRLEGLINSVKKVIYIFMDVHMSANVQTKCNTQSSDIIDYLHNNFKILDKSNKMYDFFLETSPSFQLRDFSCQEKNNGKLSYLLQLRDFFQKEITYNKDINKIFIPLAFKKVRFHYIDIRDILLYSIDYYNLQLYKILNTKSELISTDDYTNVKKYYCIITLEFKYVIDLLESNTKSHNTTNVNYPNVTNRQNMFEDLPLYEKCGPHNSQTMNIIRKKMSYIIHKLVTKYNNDCVKNTIVKFIRDKILPFANQILKNMIINCEKFQSEKSNTGSIPKLNVKYVSNLLSATFKKMDMIFVYLVDMYFLRRFLDKSYITNSIVYSGAMHSSNYINLLVNLFDFVITHRSGTGTETETDIKNINSNVKKCCNNSQQNIITDTDRTLQLFISKESLYNQCSDLSSFPHNFS